MKESLFKKKGKKPYISLASFPWKVYGLMSFHDTKHFTFLCCGMWNFGSLGIVGFFDDLKQQKMSMGMRFDTQNIWKKIIQNSGVESWEMRFDPQYIWKKESRIAVSNPHLTLILESRGEDRTNHIMINLYFNLKNLLFISIF
ncbi:hypothetical protein V6Z12_D12G082700 [Gossypium hirsutum]